MLVESESNSLRPELYKDSSILYKRLDYLVLFLILVFTGILKWEHANLPFFWDEAWVYAPALKSMAQAGPSLLPGTISTDLSRGHPLLFHFLGGIWIKIFGDTNLSLHAYAYSLFSLVCLVIFNLVKEITKSPVSAILSVVFYISQEIIFVQSVILTPEFLITLGICLWLLGWVKTNLLLSTLGLTIGLLSKESFLPFWITALSISIIDSVSKNGIRKFPYVSLLPFLISGFILGIFYSFQYIRHGWILYPYHKEMIELREWYLFFNLDIFYQLFLVEQNRQLFWIFILLAVSILLHKKKWLALIIIVTILYFIYPVHFEANYINHPKNWILIGIHLLALGIYLYQIRKKDIPERIFVVIWALSLSYLVFSMINFFTQRYMIVIFSFMSIYAGILVKYFENSTAKKVVIILFISILLLQLQLNKNRVDNRVSDWRLSMIDAVKAQVWFAQLAENLDIYNCSIQMPFLNRNSLEERNAGFRRTSIPFTCLQYQYTPGTNDYILFTSIEPEPNKEEILKTEKHQLIAEYKKGIVSFEFYKVIK
jgi:hypothetical protein